MLSLAGSYRINTTSSLLKAEQISGELSRDTFTLYRADTPMTANQTAINAFPETECMNSQKEERE